MREVIYASLESALPGLVILVMAALLAQIA